MTQERGSLLPLTLALLVGFGAGAVWRARSARPDHQPDEHADHAADPGAMSGTHERDMHLDVMTPATQDVSYAINLDNDTCPVMGRKTDGAVYTHWKGLRVQFCCDTCEADFLADPEGALREVDVDPTAALEAIGRLRVARGEEHTKLLEELSSQFHVVEVRQEGDER